MNKQKYLPTQKGFTLIELLVVIAIIGILSTVVLASLNSARAKGRDAKRIQEIGQIHTAIELYINEHGIAPNLGDDACSVPSSNSNCIASDTMFDPKVTTLDTKSSLFARIFSTPVAFAQLKGGGGKEPIGEDFNGSLRGPAWNKFGQQLKPYIASLAIDPKGGDYGYVYEAPGALETGNNSTYRIYAKKLETKDGVFGYGTGLQVPPSGGDNGSGDENGDEKEPEWVAADRKSCENDGDKKACERLREAGY